LIFLKYSSATLQRRSERSPLQHDLAGSQHEQHNDSATQALAERGKPFTDRSFCSMSKNVRHCGYRMYRMYSGVFQYRRYLPSAKDMMVGGKADVFEEQNSVHYGLVNKVFLHTAQRAPTVP
jgi:hypothetical protein